ncbi:MAG: M24 family metallopeptidase, partial [Thermoprotei archaeon]
LSPGHVFTIEPGVYIPGVGGIRIEDDFLAEEKEVRRLSSLPVVP